MFRIRVTAKPIVPLLLLLLSSAGIVESFAFATRQARTIVQHEQQRQPIHSKSCLFATKLPSGLSPFDKKPAANAIPELLCKMAASAITKATQNNVSLMEVEFPALIGDKTQFDDFENLSELDANRNWCMQLAGNLRKQQLNNRQLWLILPDDKEVELASQQSLPKQQQSNALLTSIRAVCETVVRDAQQVATPWGSNLASTFNKLTGGNGILADSSCLDALDASQKRLQIVCQPGNGGPVEDWINVKALHDASAAANDASAHACTVIVNGALDKVRDGYYPTVFFPALAKTIPFYKQFDAALYLKPVSDKGVYGWIFRVYPEPWQVILQTPIKNEQNQVVQVEDKVALTSDERPTYAQAVQALLNESLKRI
ncbi:hypothetical protein MPSEU_000621100 [Mayamaea pseudoterrestris]|nr:hypothetical protein MPSEU_000621100 [Mayamaea pseudoterrestris]